jgi:hypothetical protein
VYRPPACPCPRNRQSASAVHLEPSRLTPSFSLSTTLTSSASSTPNPRLRILDSESGTTVDYGSEFRKIPQLKQLMVGHPNFGPLAQVIENGVDYRYSRTITAEERTLKRTALLTRGSHKSAKDEPDQIDRLLKKEVDHGFAIPVPIDIVAKIKHSSAQSLSLAKQLGLSSDGTSKTQVPNDSRRREWFIISNTNTVSRVQGGWRQRGGTFLRTDAAARFSLYSSS